MSGKSFCLLPPRRAYRISLVVGLQGYIASLTCCTAGHMEEGERRSSSLQSMMHSTATAGEDLAAQVPDISTIQSASAANPSHCEPADPSSRQHEQTRTAAELKAQQHATIMDSCTTKSDTCIAKDACGKHCGEQAAEAETLPAPSAQPRPREEAQPALAARSALQDANRVEKPGAARRSDDIRGCTRLQAQDFSAAPKPSSTPLSTSMGHREQRASFALPGHTPSTADLDTAETRSEHKAQASPPAHGQDSSALGSLETRTQQKAQDALPAPEPYTATLSSTEELTHQEAQDGGPLSASHERKLSGGSSKGSMSGNPYASSCLGSHAGSTGGSPCDSHKALPGSQGGLQHELSGESALSKGLAKLQCDTEQLKKSTRERGSTEAYGAAGNPFAPPGTLRSRPASPYVEPGPSHGRSISLPQADLPAPAALAEHAASLSLPHPSQTVSLALAPAGSQCTHLPRSVLVRSRDQLLYSRLSRCAQVADKIVSCVQGLTGAELYQMHQSPMPEEGEVFRPAKDILQEIFFSRASQDAAPEALDSATDGKQALGSIQGQASTPDQAEGQQEQQQHLATKDKQVFHDSVSSGGAAEKSAGGSKVSGEAQGWSPMQGAAGLPAIATGRSMQADGALGGASIARTGSPQQLVTAEGNAWEGAWQGFQSAEAPDQAATQGPVQAAAARPGFTLLLPSREPPLPPAQLSEPSACSAAQHAGTATPGHSALPAMRSDDRQKCMQFFKQVHVTLQAHVAYDSCCVLTHEHQWHSQSLPTPARDCSALHMGETWCDGVSGVCGEGRRVCQRSAAAPCQIRRRSSL